MKIYKQIVNNEYNMQIAKKFSILIKLGRFDYLIFEQSILEKVFFIGMNSM